MENGSAISINKKLFNKVRVLNLPAGEYALFGSAPLGIRGIKECRDADVIVSHRVFEGFRGVSGWEIKTTDFGMEYLSSGQVELWKNWHPGTWNIEELIRDAEIIDGLPFVRLERVLEWKKILKREKDISDIALIEQFLGRWKFYLRPPDAWEAMLGDCAVAKETIDFESYIFVADAVGQRFLRLFKKKASEGVRVRVICDMVGSFGFFNSLDAKTLEATGVEVRFFNPMRPWRIGTFFSFSFFHRDHRKILIVDSRIGYTGGVNIEHWMRGWRDTHVRIEGAALSEMRYAFERMWDATYEKRILRKFRKPRVASSSFSFLTSAPHLRQQFLYKKMLKTIRTARRYAYFTTPYFVPSLRLFRALTAAAKRKVDVRILLPQKSDVRTVDIASGAYFTLALKSGIKIYRYRDSVLHVKTAVVDDEWGTVGSANLDNVSLLSNYEGNLVSSEKKFIQELKGQFLNDLQESDEVNYNAWIRRPFIQKLLEAITWPIHRFL